MDMAAVVETRYEDSMREKYEPKIKELNAMAEKIAQSGMKDEFGYLVTGISKLTSMMLDCDQYDLHLPADGEPIMVDRVVKVNRYVKDVYLNIHGIDRVVVGGLFLVAPIYLLPAERVHKASKNRHHVVMHPEEFGLPSSSECDYATIKQLNGSIYIAVAKFHGNFINEIVTTARNYDYVFLK